MANPSSRSRRQQVLDRLRQGGWVDGPELANERVGESEGLRRLRELREEEGYLIEERRHPDPDRDIWQYRLVEGRGDITPFRPTPSHPHTVGPLREVAQPKRVEVTDVPSPETWFCWHCGAITSNVKQHALGGYAEVICPTANRRVVGVPRRDLVKGDGSHRPRSARSPIR